MFASTPKINIIFKNASCFVLFACEIEAVLKYFEIRNDKGYEQ